MSRQSSTPSQYEEKDSIEEIVDLSRTLYTPTVTNGTNTPTRSSIRRGFTYASVAPSSNVSVHARSKQPFVSYRLVGDYERPWVNDPRMKKIRYNNWIIYTFITLGFAVSVVICYLKARTVVRHDYCLVMDDDFKTLNSDYWTHEIQLDGFGTGSFDWTTDDAKNSYVDSAGLHIVPTLTNSTTDINDDQLYNGYTLNLTDNGCTSTQASSCVAHSNSTTGSMIPPVRSARLSTKGKKTIKYGRVEVTAVLPQGDWLWPAIWMMPENDVYGAWPRSGEIDIMESRGNAAGYPYGGRDIYTSTLHWGPTTAKDSFWRTTRGQAIKRTDYAGGLHTFGIEWTEKYIFSYVDSRLKQVLFTGFDQQNALWNLGNFAKESENSTLLVNPWAPSGNWNAPFDEDFYLILNVAVGSRNGWFPDKVGNKPWLDAGASAQWDFYSAVDQWLPTWGQGDRRGMTVSRVKMYQQGKCS